MTSKRVLVVDDDADIVEYVSTLLEDNGYEVCGADESAAALAALESFSADIVIIDVLLPGRSGLDLLVQLRMDARWQEIPIIVLTGSERVLRDGCKSYMSPHVGLRGADEILGKPLDPSALLTVLRRFD